MDKEAFAREVTAMQGSLYRVAASYLSGEADRLDAVAEAIARGWEKRAALRDASLLKTWMIRILMRECVNIQRRQRRTVPVETMPETADGESAEGRMEREAQSDALERAVDSLPQRLRTMVVLHYIEGYDTREIARMMGTTKGAVCGGLARARDRLRATLGEGMI